jgi:hypothetical protein
MSQPIEVPIKFGGIAEVRKEIKQLQGELLNATNPEQARELAQNIGELRDRIADANEQANLFASGSKYERAANGLGEVRSAILNLDFEKAQDRAASLAKIAGSITFKDALGSLKQLGSTFVTLGKTLLTNPLFLIGAVIAAVAIAVFKLADKLGFLEKITKSVGQAMDALWQIAKRVLSIIPAFRDAFATDDLIKDSDKRVAQLKKEETAIGSKYDFEIAKLKAAGEDTTDAEREKRKAIMMTIAAQNDALRSLVQTGKATEEQIKVWNANQQQLTKLKQEAEIAEIAAVKKANDELKKLDEDRSKAAIAAAKAAADAAKKFAQDRLNFERQLRDLEIAAIENDLQRELAVTNEKYARLIADTLTNENLLQTEKDALILAFEQERERIKGEALERERLKDLAAIDEANAIKLKKEEDFQAAFLKMKADQAAEEKKKDDEKLERAQLIADTQEEIALNAINAISANLEEGSKAAKGIAAAQAGYHAIRGAQAIFASTAENPITGVFPAAPFIAAASALAFGVANVRKILSSPSTISSAPSGGGGAPRPSSPSGGASTPSFSLFGQSNDANTVRDTKSQEQSMTVKAVVSETDITTTQERVSKFKQMAEL